MTGFYVYVIFFVDGTPCYVGKGKGNRCESHFKRTHNRYLHRLIQKYGQLPVVIIRENLTECQAFETETAFIRAIGRRDTGTGPLLNFTDGGEGSSGYQHSDDVKIRLSEIARGRFQDPTERERISRVISELMKNPEARAKAGESKIGVSLSEEHRASLRRSAPKTHSPAHVANQAASVRGKPKSETSKAALRCYHAGLTEEQKNERSRRIAEGMMRARAKC